MSGVVVGLGFDAGVGDSVRAVFFDGELEIEILDSQQFNAASGERGMILGDFGGVGGGEENFHDIIYCLLFWKICLEKFYAGGGWVKNGFVKIKHKNIVSF